MTTGILRMSWSLQPLFIEYHILAMYHDFNCDMNIIVFIP